MEMGSEYLAETEKTESAAVGNQTWNPQRYVSSLTLFLPGVDTSLPLSRFSSFWRFSEVRGDRDSQKVKHIVTMVTSSNQYDQKLRFHPTYLAHSSG